MPLPAASLAPPPVVPAGGEPTTATELIGAVRGARARAAAAEVEVYLLSLAWADAHPALPGDEVWHAAQVAHGAFGSDAVGFEVPDDPEAVEWFAIPGVRWDAPAAFAAANAMSTTAGKAFLRDALVLRHRLPRLHARVSSGEVPVWRARKVAQVVLGEPADVVECVDLEVAHRAETIGPVLLDRLVEAVRLRLHVEEVELEAHLAAETRGAVRDDPIGATGLGQLVLRADLPDIEAFDAALSLVAAALGRSDGEGAGESVEVRRARAVGVLADPAAAMALLTPPTDGCARPAADPRSARSEVVVHLTDLALLGLDPVTHTAQPGRPMLVDVVRQWLGRSDSAVTVRPVLDLSVRHVREGYRPSATQRRVVELRDRHCVFPHCARPAARCDVDHVVPYDRHGPPGVAGGRRTGDTVHTTDTTDLAPLCRHHHRLKTHAGWKLTTLAPGTYLWTEPHGQVFLRRSDGGTTDLTPPAVAALSGDPGGAHDS